ncbi:sigma-54-dependent Fis family transcriptional regulator [Curvibacter sp. CHRR-16]|uniref:sigma-54-dependent transcriptional regulator n=1 Tax=Curvibacter sp. CHRR-16 TaxID=2835872 RepID=UPI001BD99E03|nr:sigma-54 dependent transcriptional regulator [Curvibacter sp. CHRR-16]MBT0570998.1 sigma-54-dependent Fis family transcriptional regulator [Curvibacter sp. CHRR-16]
MTTPSAHILVIDDEPDLCTLYELTLLREGYRVLTANDLAQAHSQLQQHQFDVVICDMRLPDGSGIELLQQLRTQGRSERCIVITAYGSAENAVESLKAGAFDYLSKPVDLKEFRTTVAAAVRMQNGQQASTMPLKPATDLPNTLEKMAGHSPAIQVVKERIRKVAPSMAPILIHGESGTGKELVARAIHANSHRRNGPWVAVNCSAIPENLLEAEFFGVKKGAFTGAAQDRQGFFQTAHGGTLFLDEIGDLPVAMQAKLLRAIQERRVRPLGSSQEEIVDVRIISASHKDLGLMVQTGDFRQDLYYRLNVIDIQMPALRERREDIPVLCKTLLERIAQEAGASVIPQLHPAALQYLCNLPLQGNVRELENLLHRAVALAGENAAVIDVERDENETSGNERTGHAGAMADSHASQALADSDDLPSDLQAYLDALERQILIRALDESRFNRTLAAQKLGISLRQIRYRMDRLQIPIPANSVDSA